MSPELIISALARLNELLESKHHEQKKKYKKFKQLQMMLIILSSSVALVLFVIYHASPLQMLFVLFAFNFLFFIGFKPRARYGEKKCKDDDGQGRRTSDQASEVSRRRAGEL
jgi:archaellum biogenesis protein FlaJ (TadC family)